MSLAVPVYFEEGRNRWRVELEDKGHMTDIHAHFRRSNGIHITKFETKQNPKGQADDAVTGGFERFAFDNCTNQVKHPVLPIRRRSLIAAQELLCAVETRHQCIRV